MRINLPSLDQPIYTPKRPLFESSLQSGLTVHTISRYWETCGFKSIPISVDGAWNTGLPSSVHKLSHVLILFCILWTIVFLNFLCFVEYTITVKCLKLRINVKETSPTST